jgi:2-polyprenyl-3-methyl-5-hydroxy-6-metoxy-1,4-benzoquinol methylase
MSLVCNLCGGEESVPPSLEIARVPGNTDKFRHQQFNVWRCRICRSIHALEEIDFDDAYVDYPLKKQRLNFHTRRTYAARLKLLIRGGLKHDHKILDYGCGVGHFVTFLQEQGYLNVWGYEPHFPAYADSKTLQEQYDFVMAQDVIEHVPEPKECLKMLRSLLRPNGILCIGTPDAENLNFSSHIDQAWSLHQPFHRHILSKNQLLRLLHSEGLGIYDVVDKLYLDTLFPSVNSAFLKHYVIAIGGTLDPTFGPVRIGTILSSPRLIFLVFFGYFLSDKKDIVVFSGLRKGTR